MVKIWHAHTACSFACSCFSGKGLYCLLAGWMITVQKLKLSQWCGVEAVLASCWSHQKSQSIPSSGDKAFQSAVPPDHSARVLPESGCVGGRWGGGSQWRSVWYCSEYCRAAVRWTTPRWKWCFQFCDCISNGSSHEYFRTSTAPFLPVISPKLPFTLQLYFSF